MADRVGQQLGTYHLIRLLGQGGFAEVYLGEHIHLGTQAAIKVLQTRLASEDVEKFRTEARTIARLLHPHIVRVLDFNVEEGVPFLVMDYAPNGTLRQRHPAGEPLAPLVMLPYVRQVAEALFYAHQQRLVHRDIKPENMLLGPSNDVLLSDFGIALVTQSSRYESPQDIAGTVAYMAPEQVEGHPRPASDQYSLAVVIYEWLTGSRPFHGSYQEIAVQHAVAAPQPLRARVPAISPMIEEVILTALAKDPQQRFATIQAFSTAFHQATLANQPTVIISPGAPNMPPLSINTPAPLVTPILPPPLPTPIPVAGQSGVPWAGIATPTVLSPAPQAAPAQAAPPPTPAAPDVATVVQTPATLLSPATASSTPPQPPPAKPGFSRRSVLIGAGLTGLVGLVAGGGAVIWWMRSGKSSPFTRTNTSTPPTPTPLPHPVTLYTYRGHSDIVLSAVWSPDGQRIASASNDGTVRVWDATTGANTYVYRGHNGGVETVAWSLNGRYIASGGKDNTAQVWDAQTGATLLTYTGHSDHVLGVAWSPDSSRVVSASKDKTAQVWSITNGATLQLWTQHTNEVHCVAWSPNGQMIVSGSRDNTAQVWNPVAGNGLYTFTRHSDVVESVAWSLDSQRIVSGSNDQTAQVWYARDGGDVYTYLGHSSYVYGVAWWPNSKQIASASFDQSVRVWDATNGGHTIVYTGHTGPVESVAWDSDNLRLVSASDDTTVQVWKLSSE